jgi:hypothetical protein
MKRDEIDIYHHPNKEIRSFITPVEIFPPRVQRIRKALQGDWKRTLDPSSGVLERQILRELLDLAGLEQITVKPKEIRLTKERSASWDEIEAAVLKILQRALIKKRIKAIKK